MRRSNPLRANRHLATEGQAWLTLRGAWLKTQSQQSLPRWLRWNDPRGVHAMAHYPSRETLETVQKDTSLPEYRERKTLTISLRGGATAIAPTPVRCNRRHLPPRLGRDLSFHQRFDFLLQGFARFFAG